MSVLVQTLFCSLWIFNIFIMKRLIIMAVILTAGLLNAADADACTGISLRASDGSNVVARTVEWAATPMQCGYVVVQIPTLDKKPGNRQKNGCSKWHWISSAKKLESIKKISV